MRAVLGALALTLYAFPASLGAGHDQPAIFNGAGTSRLMLPATMRTALRDYDPDFQPYRYDDYLPSIRKYQPPSKRSSLFCVIGDFNGDGVADVALQGHSGQTDLLLAIVSTKKGFRVVEVRRGRYVSPKEEWYGVGQDAAGGEIREYGLWRFLSYRAPGKINRIDAESFALKADAFEEVYFETAGMLFYYADNRFESFQTSD